MKVSKGTIARTVWLLIALINQLMVISGKEVLPFMEKDIYEIVSIIFTLAATIAAWWKNNSFTSKAIMADEFMRQQTNDEKKD